MTTPAFAAKVEHALRILSAPTGTFDPSTVEAARSIAMAAINFGVTHSELVAALRAEVQS